MSAERFLSDIGLQPDTFEIMPSNTNMATWQKESDFESRNAGCFVGIIIGSVLVSGYVALNQGGYMPSVQIDIPGFLKDIKKDIQINAPQPLQPTKPAEKPTPAPITFEEQKGFPKLLGVEYDCIRQTPPQKEENMDALGMEANKKLYNEKGYPKKRKAAVVAVEPGKEPRLLHAPGLYSDNSVVPHRTPPQDWLCLKSDRPEASRKNDNTTAMTSPRRNPSSGYRG